MHLFSFTQENTNIIRILCLNNNCITVNIKYGRVLSHVADIYFLHTYLPIYGYSEVKIYFKYFHYIQNIKLKMLYEYLFEIRCKKCKINIENN